MVNFLKLYLIRQINFAILPLTLAVAHPLPPAGEGMIATMRDFNSLSRLRERVGVRGALPFDMPINVREQIG